MDKISDKQYKSYDYTSRYANFPYYYNNQDDKFIYGITSQLSQDCSYIDHIVKDFDTLDSLANFYYGRPDLYWVIADFNRIQDPFIKLKDNFTRINIPAIKELKYKG